MNRRFTVAVLSPVIAAAVIAAAIQITAATSTRTTTAASQTASELLTDHRSGQSLQLVRPGLRASRDRPPVTGPAVLITPAWQALVHCEATFRGWKYGAPGIGVDPGYNFEGGPNFTHQTWIEFGGATYAQHAWGATPEQQIVIAGRVLRAQGPHAWPVCGPKTGLTRSDAPDPALH